MRVFFEVAARTRRGSSMLLRLGAGFAGDRCGNVAMMFGIVLVPILGFVGAAIDYTLANNVRSKLLAAADSAVLLAVSRSELSASPDEAKAAAIKLFESQATMSGVEDVSLTLTVTDDPVKGRTAVASFTKSVATEFMKIAGFPTISLGGGATAVAPTPIYIDFHLLLDNTPSMGVAATPADVTKMVNATSDKCAFACHDLSTTNNYYNKAKSLGVTMRIDVVRQATQQLMDTAKSAATVPNQYRMAIFTFGSSCTAPGINTVSPLTSNLSSAKAMANAIDLMTIPYQGYNNDQCTDFDGAFAGANSSITTPGPGSALLPQKWLFVVSDGVADAYYPATCSKKTTSGRCQEPLKPANCTALKARGVNIAVLYTTYLALPTNSWYNTWIAPFNAGPYNPSTNSEIAKNMKACASDGFYFEVSPTDGISDAMNALFQKAIANARLTR